MYPYLLVRGGGALIVLLGVTLLVFSLAFITPGDPVALRTGLENVEPVELERLREELGLNRPLWVQYGDYVGALFRGDLGYSYRSGFPVTELLLPRLRATLELSITALLVAVLTAVPLGVLAARHRGSWADHATGLGVVLGMSMPAFWLGLLLLLTFALNLSWFPFSGRGGSPILALWPLLTRGDLYPLSQALRHLVLPSITLATPLVALFTRFIRQGVLDVLGEDYIRTARAKGVAEGRVLYRHALKNALIPMITVLGIYAGRLIGSAVVVETIFAWPGLGRMAVTAVRGRDFPVLQGTVLVVAVTFVLINWVLDGWYGWLDPRIRYE